MTPEQVGTAYDKITHRWDDNTFDRNNGIEQHKRAITFVKNRGGALDVGCGPTGRFIDLLASEGFEPEGVDISKKMIALAQQRHPTVVFHHGDICEWQIDKKYDFITAWDSLWHIPLEQQEHVIAKLAESLNSGGILIFSFGGTHEPGSHTNKVMGPEMYYATLGTEGFLNSVLKHNCQIKHLEFDQHPELHTYLIVQKGDAK